MEMSGFLVMLLVVGAPVALFLAMRRPGRMTAARQQPAAEGRRPPDDFGMARERSDGPAAAQPDAEDSNAAAVNATAAAAGGALILAVGAARQHAGEAGGESPQAGIGHGGDGPGSGETGGSGDGDGGDGGGGGAGGGD